MLDLIRELEEAAGEWPEDHRLAKACRRAAEEIERLRSALARCEEAKEDYRDAMVVFDREAREAKAEVEKSRHALRLWMHYDDVQTYEAYLPAILATKEIIGPVSDVPPPPPLP